jgi:hypothetical protein
VSSTAGAVRQALIERDMMALYITFG